VFPRDRSSLEDATMEQTTSLVGVPKLRARGWTPALIAAFLGEADATRPNPRFRSAAPMRLYQEDRVIAAEVSAAWQAAAARARARSARARVVTDRKRAELLRQIAALPISVRRLPEETAQARAITAYNRWRVERVDERALRQQRYDDFTPASAQSDPAFLARITVNQCGMRSLSMKRRLRRCAGEWESARRLRCCGPGFIRKLPVSIQCSPPLYGEVLVHEGAKALSSCPNAGWWHAVSLG
jgi:hypothetical protein